MSDRSFGTHDGTFHADEVTACAMLLLLELIDIDKIVRTRDQAKLDHCEWVCDVGGIYDPSKKRFDHHQSDYQGEYSSAGMILAHLLETGLIDPGLAHHFRQTLMIGIDAHDNGRAGLPLGFCSFSHVVSNFVPVRYDASDAEQDAAFIEVLGFVLGHLKRSKERFLYAQSCRHLVLEAMKRSDECLMFDQPIPWMDAFFELDGKDHPALFVVMPSGHNWKLRGIPPTGEERMKVRKPLPEAWAGLLGEDLEKVAKVPGAVFCHKGRFISVWESKEAALQALAAVLKK